MKIGRRLSPGAARHLCYQLGFSRANLPAHIFHQHVRSRPGGPPSASRRVQENPQRTRSGAARCFARSACAVRQNGSARRLNLLPLCVRRRLDGTPAAVAGSCRQQSMAIGGNWIAIALLAAWTAPAILFIPPSCHPVVKRRGGARPAP